MCQKRANVSLDTMFGLNWHVSYNHQCWSGPCFPTRFRFGVSNINWVPVQSGTALYSSGYRSLYNTLWSSPDLPVHFWGLKFWTHEDL